MNETTIPRSELDNSEIVIEHARPEDAEAIMTIKRDASLVAYPNDEHGITLDDVRKKFSDEELNKGIENWHHGIANEREGSSRQTFVVRINDEVAGYTSPYIEDGQRRVGQLYVSPDAQGKGIGSLLLAKNLDWHGIDQDVYLHVVSYNKDAIRLYEKFGFQKIGEESPERFDEKQGIKLLPEIEMLRPAKSD
jgi:ribosomal protein S18 acetylase RimI-like enzyme